MMSNDVQVEFELDNIYRSGILIPPPGTATTENATVYGSTPVQGHRALFEARQTATWTM